jgi:putative lipoprotein
MRLKNIYGIILSIIAISLTSCSSDLNNEGNTLISPTKTAKRSLTLSADNAMTRSYISLQDGNQWRKGDKFMVYNLTSPAGTEDLVAKGNGANTLLEGDVTCADNDEIAVFFPYKNSTGNPQYKVEINLNENYVTENGVVTRHSQDGKLENLKYFDFSYGTTHVKTTPGSNNVTGNVQMKKQYAVLRLKFKADGQELKNLKKLTISNVITSGRFDMSIGQLIETQSGDITITPSAPLDSFVVAVFPEEHFRPTFTVVGSDNKTYRFSVGVDLPIEKANYDRYLVAVKEYDPNPPYVEVEGVKWGKYNLQYTPDTKENGWVDGYHLAKNPWDYFYPSGNLPKLNGGVDADAIEFDRFRWGDISKAHNYANASRPHYSHSTTGISEKILDSNSEFGDLAYYASKHNWRLPTMDDFKKLMANTTQYAGYIDVGGHRVYGSLFIPDGVAHGYVVPNGVTVQKSSNGNITNKGQLKESGKGGMKLSGNQLYAFTKERINEGIFFPAAGTIGAYSDGNPQLIYPGNRGIYWTADPKNADQAYSFVFGMLMGQYSLSTVGNPTAGNDYPPKTDMYSIRPIYIGD